LKDFKFVRLNKTQNFNTNSAVNFQIFQELQT